MSQYILEKISAEEFEGFYHILEKDFCFLERKSYENEKKALENPRFIPSFICREEKPVGYICCWEFEQFLFVEHFAIFEELRDQKIGSSFLSEFLEKESKMVVLEVERPTDEVSEKRIRFYKRMGFFVNAYDYYQPSYHQDEALVPMFICSHGREISEAEYLEITKQIKNIVYQNGV